MMVGKVTRPFPQLALLWPAYALLALSASTASWLRLDDMADQQAFRRWFTFLAEAQALREPQSLPAEITDCAGLVRFAYRESLRKHDNEWAKQLSLPVVPGFPSVRKYVYPFTPLRANLFQTGPNTFQEFADAKTLWRENTYFVSRDVREAAPGDLLFFRQLSQVLPFHVMIYLHRSHLEAGSASWVVYHTGPSRGSKGEIRRVSLADLTRHPSPQWRPLPGNSNFLGVYRWNILKSEH